MCRGEAGPAARPRAPGYGIGGTGTTGSGEPGQGPPEAPPRTPGNGPRPQGLPSASSPDLIGGLSVAAFPRETAPAGGGGRRWLLRARGPLRTDRGRSAHPSGARGGGPHRPGPGRRHRRHPAGGSARSPSRAHRGRPRRSRGRSGRGRVQRPRPGRGPPGARSAGRRGHAAPAGIRADPLGPEEMVPSVRRRPLGLAPSAPAVPGAYGRAADPGRRGRMLSSRRRVARSALDGPWALAGAASPRPPRRVRRPPTGAASTQGLRRAEAVGLPGL